MWTKINVFFNHFLPQKNRFGGAMVCVLSSSVVDREFEPRSGQTKNYKIGMFCFSAKHAALKKKGQDWLSRNQDNQSACWGHVYPGTVVSVR